MGDAMTTEGESVMSKVWYGRMNDWGGGDGGGDGNDTSVGFPWNVHDVV